MILFFVIMVGFYSSTETAFSCLNKYQFMVEADNGSKKAKLIVKLYDRFDSTLISVLIGNNLVAIGISTLSTVLFVALIGPYIDNGVVSLISSLSMSLITFLFGDTIPKLIAKRIPEKVASLNVYPMYFFIILFYPFAIIFRGLNALMMKIFRSKPEPEMSEEDFASIIESVEDSGELEENESDIIQASFDFGDTKVKEVLTPKRRMLTVNLKGLKNSDLVEIIKNSSYSRIPLYYEDPNNIVGILVVKNFLGAYFDDPLVAPGKLMQKPYFVTPSITMEKLMEGFKANHTQLAIVEDKEGKLIGMVTMEDVLEELVGKIAEDDGTKKGAKR